MSMKRIPSVGKTLMSRIFARSSATSIARLYYSLHVAARKTQGGAKVSARLADRGAVRRDLLPRHLLPHPRSVRRPDHGPDPTLLRGNRHRHRVGVSLAAPPAADGFGPQSHLTARRPQARADVALPNRRDHDSSCAMASGRPASRGIAPSGLSRPSARGALLVTWMTRIPAARAPWTSSTSSSPTCTALSGPAPTARSVRAKISGSGLRTPTSSEKVVYRK